MVTEIDLWAVKTRTKNVLEVDTTLNDFFRDFHVGTPTGNLVECQPIPYLFITNDEGLIEDSGDASTVQNDAPVTSRHTLHFRIVFMINEKDGSTTEKLHLSASSSFLGSYLYGMSLTFARIIFPACFAVNVSFFLTCR